MTSIIDLKEDKDILSFTIKTNVSIANAMRRTIINEIPTVAIKTFPHNESDCTITKNTSRFNNEIIKHRLSLIPIHITDMTIPFENYLLELNVTNDTDIIKYVTSRDFIIKDTNTEKYLSKSDINSIFPKNPITNDYIEFLRLRPKLANNIEGESIQFSAKLSIQSAMVNSVYNVVSTCAYFNTPDPIQQNDAWAKEAVKLQKVSNLSPEELENEKKNWYLLDGMRYFIPDTFNFIIKSIGVFDNKYIVNNALDILLDKCAKFKEYTTSNNLNFINITENTNTTINNSFIVKLIGEDYTLGKVIELFIFQLYFEGDKSISFCGFVKEHPHDTFSLLKLSFTNTTTQDVVREVIIQSLQKASDTFSNIKQLFNS